jgi:hypothetical protein
MGGLQMKPVRRVVHCSCLRVGEEWPPLLYPVCTHATLCSSRERFLPRCGGGLQGVSVDDEGMQ